MNFEELKGLAISNAINNVIKWLMDDDYNTIYNLEDITIGRIYVEICGFNLKFDKNGTIL